MDERDIPHDAGAIRIEVVWSPREHVWLVVQNGEVIGRHTHAAGIARTFGLRFTGMLPQGPSGEPRARA